GDDVHAVECLEQQLRDVLLPRRGFGVYRERFGHRAVDLGDRGPDAGQRFLQRDLATARVHGVAESAVNDVALRARDGAALLRGHQLALSILNLATSPCSFEARSSSWLATEEACPAAALVSSVICATFSTFFAMSVEAVVCSFAAELMSWMRRIV